MDYIKLTEEVLSVEEATSLVTHPSCGAISLFIGTTRDNFEGKDVVQLAYEAYQDMAEKEMRKLCIIAREKWSLKHIALHHRLGLVPVTESSVIIAVSSEHRRESLEAVTFLIDGLKAKVPIWKKELYSDGTGDWKRNKECVWMTDEKTESAVNKKEITNNNKRSLSEERNVEIRPPVKRIREENEFLNESMKDSNTLEEKTDLDPTYVQIILSKEEINRRIAAFQKHKREELDVLNIQEFCSLSGGPTSQNSCARTSAVVLRSKGSRSHLKLTHVVNEWGPQTLGMDPGSISANQAKEIIKQDGICNNNGSSREDSLEPGSNSSPKFSGDNKCKQDAISFSEEGMQLTGIEERLQNLESHLRIVPGSAIPRDIYARLKAVEDRVLHLEGISPEYFRNYNVLTSRKNQNSKEIKASEDDICLNDLDVKIHELKMKLKQKQIKQEL
ncbi:molybdopterin synthase catalytic subunit-like [Portunus trituberculatus]|uniref:molybdopterin synthase catalytic subunit-like n=1 Tax=Portunus trituberculatus TaxID=210409 RepID=UPI001E1CF748|nr:molybdopterin synthase catalytic subunit-like [Portunus trituberculatus]